MATLSASASHTPDTPSFAARPHAAWLAGPTLLQKFALLSFPCVLAITLAVCVTWASFLRRHLISHDAAVVGELVDALLPRSLPASYLERAPDGDTTAYDHAFGGIVSSAGIVRLILWDRTGRIIWSDERGLIGTRVRQNAELEAAVRGRIQVGVVRPGKEEHQGALRAYERLEEIYLPVRYEKGGPILGVLEIYRRPPLAVLDRLLTVVWVVSGGGGLVLYLMLFGIVRRSSQEQARLGAELMAHARTLEERVGERTAELLAKTREASTLYEEMKATKEYLEHLIASSVDGIVTVGARGRVTFASQAARRMFDPGATELVGTPVSRYWARGAGALRAFRRRLAVSGRIENYETELRAVDTRVVSVNLSASVLRGSDGRITGVLAVVRDVSDVRKMQVQMVRAERLVTAGLLAAGVAHEVGNPLTCISSLAQILGTRARDAEIRRGLDDIEMHADRIERILQGLTQLTRPRPSAFQWCAIEDILKSAMQLARHNPVARRMTMTASFDGDLPSVHVAPDQLLQVFLNLILNAAEAGGALSIQTILAESALRIVFRDTGRGMSREQLTWLFDPFASTKDDDAHMGLGLFVSHEIVRQHGGTIVAESEPGSGSTFTVHLPVER
jgi:PAS domain S-box-containing protein